MMTVAELDALRAEVESTDRLQVDPLGFVPREGASVERQEIIAFVAAGLALGRVSSIGRSVARVVAHLDDLDDLGFGAHRWIRSADVRAVVGRIRALQERHGSLGAAFALDYCPGDMRSAMVGFAARLLDGLPATRGVRSLAVSPAGGSACKRMLLFLRWVVRPAAPDLGLWADRVSTADLLMPLDAHVIRFARRFGLTSRATVDWKMVEQVTAAFRALCPEDPCRWDFAIAHHGMTAGW